MQQLRLPIYCTILAFACPGSLPAQSPALDIKQLDNTKVRLTWPAAFEAWRPERAPGLDDPDAWTLVDEPTMGSGALLRADVPIDARQEFFRLRNLDFGPPNLSPIGAQTIALGSSLTLQLSATDQGGGTLTYFALGLPANSTFATASGTFRFRPESNQIGPLEVLFGVRDEGQLEDRELVTITVAGPLPGGVTAISGIVLDTTDAVEGTQTPVIGTVISVLGNPATATSGADGRFLLENIPGGKQVLDLNVSTALPAPDGAPYAGFREEITLIEGVTNVIDRPFYLPRLAAESLTTVDPNATTTVNNPTLGAKLVVPPNTAKLGADNFTGQLSISPVPQALAPAALPEDLGFGNLITIQPVGVTFATPVALTMPNMDGFPPGSELDLWSLDAGTGQFTIVGRGRVTSDAQFIETISGGIRAADWHDFLAPRPGAATGKQGNKNIRRHPCAKGTSLVFLADGNLQTDFVLPPLYSHSQSRELRLVYNSARANPYTVLPYTATKAVATVVPQRMSAEVRVPGLETQTGFFDTSSFLISREDRFQGSFAIKAASLLTGLYPYELRLTSHYPNSTVSARVPGEFIVVNQNASPFGAGWGLAGLQRLHPQPNGTILLTDGDGSSYVFTPSSGTLAQADPVPFLDETGFFERFAVTMLTDGRLVVLRGNRLAFINRFGGIDQDLDLTRGPDGQFASGLNTAWGVAGLSDGGVVVTGSIGAGGHFRIYNSDGTERTNGSVFAFPFSGFDGGPFQSSSAPKALPDGNFAIVWNSTQDATTGPLGSHPQFGDLIPAPETGTAIDIRARYYDPNGTPLPTSFSAAGDAFIVTEGPVSYNPQGTIVIDSRYGSQRLTDLDILPDSSLLVGYRGTRWIGTSQFWGPNNYAFMRALSADGPQLSETQFSQQPAAFERRSDLGAQLAVLSDGRMAAVYDQPTPAGAFALKLQYLNQDGSPANGSGEIDLGITIPGAINTRYFSVHPAPSGGFLIVYSQQDAGFQADMHLRRYDQNAQLLESISIAAGPGDDRLTGITDGRPGEWFLMHYNDANQRLRVLRYFENPGGPDAFLSPRGDYSVFKPVGGGGFVRTFPDGTRSLFASSGELSSVIDANGNATNFSYAEDRLQQVAFPGGRSFTLHYAGSRVSQVVDDSGRLTGLLHDIDGNLVRATLPDGAVRKFGYDRRHLMTSETDANGLRKSRRYDATGIFLDATLPDGSLFSVEPSGLVGAPAGSLGNPASPIDPQNAYAVVTDGSGTENKILLDSSGFETRLIAPSGEVTDLTRDLDGNILALASSSGQSLRFGYDARGNVNAFAEEPIASFFRATFSENHSKLLSLTDHRGDTVRFTLDAQGNPDSLTTPLGRTTTLSWDAQGKLTNEVNTQGTARTYSYDSTGNVTTMTEGSGPAARTYTFAYNQPGNLAALTDPLGRTSTVDYDPTGRVIRHVVHGLAETTLARDREGRIVSVTPPGGSAHTMAYTHDGNLRRYALPSIPGVPGITTWEYDPAGRLIAERRPGGQNLTVEYDPGGRAVRTSLTRGDHLFSYRPGDAQPASQTSADGLSTAFSYLGDRLTQLDWSGQAVGSLGTSYDRGGRVSAISVNGQPIDYLYDADGALTRAGDLVFTHSPASGLLTEAQLGVVTTSWQYNGFGEMARSVTTVNGTPFFTVDYERDQAGQLTRNTETLQGTITTLDYSYDLLGRLHRVAGPGGTTTYTYDLNGNRLSRTSASGNETGSYDARDRVTTYGNATYTHDASGDLLSRTVGGQTTTYAYDELGNLLRVTRPDRSVVSYQIEATGQRMVKALDGTVQRKFLWQEPLQIAAELDADNHVVNRMVYATRHNVPDYLIRGGVAYRLVTDHLGSVRFVINTRDGSVAQALAYDEFGRVLHDTAPAFQPFGFAGGLYDPDTGLLRFGVRDYDPHPGRWTTPDPILLAGSLNLYSYVENDPVNLADASGENPLLVWGARILVVYAAKKLYDSFKQPRLDLARAGAARARLQHCSPDNVEELIRNKEDFNRKWVRAAGSATGAGSQIPGTFLSGGPPPTSNIDLVIWGTQGSVPSN